MDTAKEIANHIYREMIEFQNSLTTSDDVFVSFIPFAKEKIIQVSNMLDTLATV